MNKEFDFDLSELDLESEFEVYESPFHAAETPVEASKSLAKTKMIIFLRDIIERAEWTQGEAANKLGVDQPRISNLMRGKIDKFTVDFLMTMLDRLKVPITFTELKDGSIKFEIKPPQLTS